MLTRILLYVLAKITIGVLIYHLFQMWRNRASNQPPVHYDDYYEMGPSAYGKFGLAVLWALVGLFFWVFYIACDTVINIQFIAIWIMIFVFTLYVTISFLTTKIYYNDEYLYIQGPIKSHEYNWQRLRQTRVFEDYEIMAVKFEGKFFWVFIPMGHYGFFHFQDIVRRKSTWANFRS